MTSVEFAALLVRMTGAAEAGDGAAFAACFTQDAVYHDYVYGPHEGRKDIAHMLEGLFRRDAGDDYRWEMFDPVFDARDQDGGMGYAWSLSCFTSTVPEYKGRFVVIDGMSRFVLRDGLIVDYRESVNAGVAMHQLGVTPGKMDAVFRRWAGWLKARPETQAYLVRTAVSE